MLKFCTDTTINLITCIYVLLIVPILDTVFLFTLIKNLFIQSNYRASISGPTVSQYLF